jgi:hypothetical protein
VQRTRWRKRIGQGSIRVRQPTIWSTYDKLTYLAIHVADTQRTTAELLAELTLDLAPTYEQIDTLRKSLAHCDKIIATAKAKNVDVAKTEALELHLQTEAEGLHRLRKKNDDEYKALMMRVSITQPDT